MATVWFEVEVALPLRELAEQILAKNKEKGHLYIKSFKYKDVTISLGKESSVISIVKGYNSRATGLGEYVEDPL